MESATLTAVNDGGVRKPTLHLTPKVPGYVTRDAIHRYPCAVSPGVGEPAARHNDRLETGLLNTVLSSAHTMWAWPTDPAPAATRFTAHARPHIISRVQIGLNGIARRDYDSALQRVEGSSSLSLNSHRILRAASRLALGVLVGGGPRADPQMRVVSRPAAMTGWRVRRVPWTGPRPHLRNI